MLLECRNGSVWQELPKSTNVKIAGTTTGFLVLTTQLSFLSGAKVDAANGRTASPCAAWLWVWSLGTSPIGRTMCGLRYGPARPSYDKRGMLLFD
jgi:hypothetical protein